jgi:hypothetical protein
MREDEHNRRYVPAMICRRCLRLYCHGKTRRCVCSGYLAPTFNSGLLPEPALLEPEVLPVTAAAAEEEEEVAFFSTMPPVSAKKAEPEVTAAEEEAAFMDKPVSIMPPMSDGALDQLPTPEDQAPAERRVIAYGDSSFQVFFERVTPIPFRQVSFEKVAIGPGGPPATDSKASSSASRDDQRQCPSCRHQITSPSACCPFCHVDFGVQPDDVLPPPVTS